MKSLFYRSRRYIPRGLRHLVYRAGMFFGDEFVTPTGQFGGGATDDSRFPSVAATLEYLRAWGFRPRTIVDAGAFRGDWTRFAKTVFPEAQVLMIEPQERWIPQLQDVAGYYTDVRVECGLLGAADGTPVEFVEMANGSSVFEEQSPVPRTRVAKQTVTLPTLLRKHAWPGVDLLKIDVQGSELHLLQGAAPLLPGCQLILVECSLIPVNRGCPLVGEVVAFAHEHGFRLLDICTLIRRKDDALWQTDLAFINGQSTLVPRPQIDASNW